MNIQRPPYRVSSSRLEKIQTLHASWSSEVRERKIRPVLNQILLNRHKSDEDIIRIVERADASARKLFAPDENSLSNYFFSPPNNSYTANRYKEIAYRTLVTGGFITQDELDRTLNPQNPRNMRQEQNTNLGNNAQEVDDLDDQLILAIAPYLHDEDEGIIFSQFGQNQRNMRQEQNTNLGRASHERDRFYRQHPYRNITQLYNNGTTNDQDLINDLFETNLHESINQAPNQTGQSAGTLLAQVTHMQMSTHDNEFIRNQIFGETNDDDDNGDSWEKTFTCGKITITVGKEDLDPITQEPISETSGNLVGVMVTTTSQETNKSYRLMQQSSLIEQLHNNVTKNQFTNKVLTSDDILGGDDLVEFFRNAEVSI